MLVEWVAHYTEVIFLTPEGEQKSQNYPFFARSTLWTENYDLCAFVNEIEAEIRKWKKTELVVNRKLFRYSEALAKFSAAQQMIGCDTR